MGNLLLFHPEMISAQFFWGNVFLREERMQKKFKFWNFWERPLFEIWEYAFNDLTHATLIPFLVCLGPNLNFSLNSSMC